MQRKSPENGLEALGTSPHRKIWYPFNNGLRGCLGEELVAVGAWIGANCTVCQGVTAHPYSMATVGSIVTKDMDAYGIYRGNPAVKIKERVIEN